MLCVGKDVRGCALLNDEPLLHDDNVISNIRDHSEVVTDEQNANVALFLQRLNQAKNLGLNGDVQGCGRLIGNQKFGLSDECHSNHDPLSHAAGELERIGAHSRFRVLNTHFIK